MSTEITNLTAEARDGAGSRPSRKARAAGRVPVNVYGHGLANASVTLNEHDLELALNTTAQIFTLKIEGKDESCLVREVQYDTFGQKVLHVDFTRIDLSEEVEVVVAIEFRGQAAGVVEGGSQIIHHPTLAVRCRADAIPESILVDVTELEIGHAIHAGEIELPAGIKLDDHHMKVEEPIVGVVAAKVEVVEETEDGDEATEGDAKDGGGDAKASEGDDKKPSGG